MTGLQFGGNVSITSYLSSSNHTRFHIKRYHAGLKCFVGLLQPTVCYSVSDNANTLCLERASYHPPSVRSLLSYLQQQQQPGMQTPFKSDFVKVLFQAHANQ